MRKPKTQAQLDKAADQRLRKTYNISLKDYEDLLEAGDGVCWISGRDAGTRRLHVDHDHGYKKVKISVLLQEKNHWYAHAEYNDVTYNGFGTKRAEAVRSVKRQLLRASVRGLLSYSMNAGLQKFSDDPKLLRAAADYLERHKAESPLSGQEAK